MPGNNSFTPEERNSVIRCALDRFGNPFLQAIYRNKHFWASQGAKGVFDYLERFLSSAKEVRNALLRVGFAEETAGVFVEAINARLTLNPSCDYATYCETFVLPTLALLAKHKKILRDEYFGQLPLAYWNQAEQERKALESAQREQPERTFINKINRLTDDQFKDYDQQLQSDASALFFLLLELKFFDTATLLYNDPRLQNPLLIVEGEILGGALPYALAYNAPPQLVQLILQKQSESFLVMESGSINVGPLFYINKANTLAEFLNIATDLGLTSLLKSLFSQKYTDPQTQEQYDLLYYFSMVSFNADIIKLLLGQEQFIETVGVGNIFNTLRLGYFSYPERIKQYQRFFSIMQKYRDKLPKKPSILFSFPENKMTLQYYWERLFRDPFPSDQDSTRRNKKDALRIIAAQILALTNSPQECVPYLEHINKELAKYYSQKHDGNPFPILPKTSYEFREVHGFKVPMPTDSFGKGIKKDSNLQELLIGMLREMGIAASAEKWVGFISTDFANKFVSDGNVFLEDFTSGLLFHGKLAHIIQLVMVALHILSSEMDCSYYEKGIHQLTFKEILSSLVTENFFPHSLHKTLWGQIFDTLPCRPTVASPHLLYSFIMTNQALFPTLADYLIDSGCKNLQRSVDAHAAVFEKLSLSEYLAIFEQLNHLDVFKVPELFNYSMARLSKERYVRIGNTNRFQREYSPLVTYQYSLKVSKLSGVEKPNFENEDTAETGRKIRL